MKAAIFMATYNGADYLPEQLNSIISQTFKDWELFISDDQSNDMTLEILKEYQKKDNRISAILENQHEHGPFANYFNLLRNLKSSLDDDFKYFFYCDQDDVWIPTKMEYEINILRNAENDFGDMPFLCYSDMELINELGEDSGEKFSKFKDIKLENPYNIFFSNSFVWGTSMAHNKSLWDMLFVPNEFSNWISHDHYIAKYAVSFGKIIYVDETLVLYRRHGNNVSQIPHEYNLCEALKRFFKNFHSVIDNQSRIYWSTLYFIKHAPKKTAFMEDCQRAIEKGGINALHFLFKYKIHPTQNKYNQIALELILFTSLYKRTKYFQSDDTLKL